MKSATAYHLLNGNAFLERFAQLCREVDNHKADLLRGSQLEQAAADILESWRSAVVTEPDNLLLQHFFSYQSGVLNSLAEHLQIKNPANDIYLEAVYALLESLCTLHARYIDDAMLVSVPLRQLLIQNIKDDVCRLTTFISEFSMDEKLKGVLINYLYQLSGEMHFSCVYGQVKYFREFVIQLLLLEDGKCSEITEEVINAKLLDLEFNHLDVFINFRKGLLKEISGRKGKQKLALINEKIEYYSFKAKGALLTYDPRWPPLSFLLQDYLVKEREKVIADLEGIGQQRPVSTFKLKLQLPLAHLAFLLKLFSKKNILGDTPMKEVFSFFSSHFSTKRQPDISPGGISKEYYTKNMVTAVQVRALLNDMIKMINQDYFPVWVVIGIAAFGH